MKTIKIRTVDTEKLNDILHLLIYELKFDFLEYEHNSGVFKDNVVTR